MAGRLDESGLASTQLKILDHVNTAGPRYAQVGRILAGKYRVERVLGEGGMGMVLAVTNLEQNQLYALKFLLPELAREPEVVARFMREAEAASKIKNEHIARVSDVGMIENGPPFLVMEHLAGEDLSARLKKEFRLPIMETVDIVMQACDALVEAHSLGIVHRDLKPANLFLTRRPDGSPLVKVLDFGISKALSETDDAKLTKTHEAFGSPAYMSPEQIRSARNVDARTDVWALGVILHELLTGDLPFEGTTASALLAAATADPARHVRASRPEVRIELDAAVARCLEKNREARFPSVAQLAMAIAPFGSASSLAITRRIGDLVPPGSLRAPAAPVSQPMVSAHDASKSAVPVIVAAVALFLVVAVGGAAFVLGRMGRGDPPRASASAMTSPIVTESAPAPPAPHETPVVVVPTPVVSEAPSASAKPHPAAQPAPKKATRPAPSASQAPAPAPAPTPTQDPTSTSH